jgi:ParB family chromosome partitioning protein
VSGVGARQSWPDHTVPIVVKEVPDESLLEIALIENIQRENLNPIEEAQAYKKLIETVGLTQEALASRVGRDPLVHTQLLRLLKLTDDIQQLVKEGGSQPDMRGASGVESPDLQRRISRQIIDGGLSVRATEQLVQKASEEKPQDDRLRRRSEYQSRRDKVRRALGPR